MDRFIRSIDLQIAFNQGKNILFDKPEEIFQFVPDTVSAIANMNELNRKSENFLIDYAAGKALEAFCRINQYYSFDSQSKKGLRKIYADSLALVRTGRFTTKEISRSHYQNLKNWLKTANPFAVKLYASTDEMIEPVPCSAYSAGLQINILQLDAGRLMQPVLDVGCGKQGNLVRHLAEKGIDAYGIDRFSFTFPNLLNWDWLEYNYGVNKWGTIISNLGFSNHFQHHHLRADGNYLEYGKTYMNMLRALKVGGCFHYAPDLPFIEKYLDHKQYDLVTYPIPGRDFKTTIIKRLE